MKNLSTVLLMLIMALTFSCKKVQEDLPSAALQSNKNASASDSVMSPNEWDNNLKKLNVVYFIPSDLDTLANYKNRFSIIMYDIQEFYAQNMNREGYGRLSFGLNRTNGELNVIVIRGKLPKSSYGNSDDDITQEINDYFVANPTQNKSVHNMIFIPQYGNNAPQPFYGSGTNCFVTDYPALGSTLLRGGGEAHELGHALGLPHNGETKATKISLGTALMGNGVYTYKDQPTFLTAADCAILARCQVIRNESRSDWYTPQTLNFTSGQATTSNNIFTVSGTFSSSMPVTKVIAYHDATPYGVNSDYDALTFTSDVTGGNSFSIACPLADFYNTTNQTQLRLKFVFANGFTLDKNVVYTFSNNQPVTTNFFPVAIVSGSNYRLVTFINNSSVIDVAGGGTTDGTKTLLWTASTPAPNNQVWKVTSTGSGYYKLQPLNAPTKAMEVAGGGSNNYAQIQISSYTGANGQLFKLLPALGGGYELEPASAPGSRVDVENNSTTNGTKIQLFKSNNGNAQKWKFDLQ